MACALVGYHPHFATIVRPLLWEPGGIGQQLSLTPSNLPAPRRGTTSTSKSSEAHGGMGSAQARLGSANRRIFVLPMRVFELQCVLSFIFCNGRMLEKKAREQNGAEFPAEFPARVCSVIHMLPHASAASPPSGSGGAGSSMLARTALGGVCRLILSSDRRGDIHCPRLRRHLDLAAFPAVGVHRHPGRGHNTVVRPAADQQA